MNEKEQTKLNTHLNTQLNLEIDWLNEVVAESTSVNRKQNLHEQDLLRVISIKSNFGNSFFNEISTNTKPTAYWGYRRKFYCAKHSEGNRFITNDQL